MTSRDTQARLSCSPHPCAAQVWMPEVSPEGEVTLRTKGEPAWGQGPASSQPGAPQRGDGRAQPGQTSGRLAPPCQRS